MASGRILLPCMPAIDRNGNPVEGALLYFYQNNTETPRAVYADAGLTTPLSNPVVADSAGQFASIFADNSLLYSVRGFDPHGTQLPSGSWDDVQASVALAYPNTLTVSSYMAGVIQAADAPAARALLGATSQADVDAAVDAGMAETLELAESSITIAQDRLKLWHRALGGAVAQKGASQIRTYPQARLVIPGDSIPYGYGAPDDFFTNGRHVYGWPAVLKGLFRNIGVQANNSNIIGGGVAAYNAGAPSTGIGSLLNYDSQFSKTGSVVDGTVFTIGGHSFTIPTGASITLTPGEDWVFLELIMVKDPSYGSAVVTNSLGTIATESLTGADTIFSQKYPVFASASTDYVTITASGGPVEVLYAGVWNYDNMGVSVLNASASGATTAQWTADTGDVRDAIKVVPLLAADCTILTSGVNDLPGINLTTYEANKRIEIETALTTGSVLLCGLTPVTTISQGTQDTVNALLKSLADEHNTAWFSPRDLLGTAAEILAYGGYIPDGVHLRGSLHADIARSIYNLLTRV